MTLWGLVPLLNLPQDLNIRFVFPNAPIRPVTINGSLPCRAWFDIVSLHDWSQRDNQGLTSMMAAIQGIVEQQIASGIPSDNIVLVGFSQGGMVALAAGLQFRQPLAGIMGLSTCLPYLPEECVALLGEKKQSAPVLFMHGDQDDVLPQALGQLSFQVLQQLGYAVQFETYPMAHQVCPPQIALISTWLQQQLAAR